MNELPLFLSLVALVVVSCAAQSRTRNKRP